ncbi:unnamed protein product, partial [Laminaria digitata]
VKVTDSKQTLTINCSLLSHRGNLDEAPLCDELAGHEHSS